MVNLCVSVRPSRSPINQIIGATILLVLAGAIFFPAYLYWNRSIQRSVTELTRCGNAPQFESSDQAGRSIGRKELKGTIWVAGFVDVGKPADAELLSSKFAELDQNVHGAKEAELVSFYVGAEKNAVKDFARRYEASDRWHLVPVSGQNTLVQDWAAATSRCRDGLREQNIFVLIDREGEIRGVYAAAAPEVVQKILADAGNLLRAEHQTAAP